MKPLASFNTWLILGWLLVFGLPFVFITDLFPLHRFGMFARLPKEKHDIQMFYIEVRSRNDQWKKLETHNPYFDESYFYLLAARAFESEPQADELALKLSKTLDIRPDSIRLVKVNMKSQTENRLIFPRP